MRNIAQTINGADIARPDRLGASSINSHLLVCADTDVNGVRAARHMDGNCHPELGYFD